MPAISEIANFMGELAPWELAEEWDNVGVLVQCAETTDKILVSLDITTQVAQEAQALGCGLVVAHHPVIFKPLRSLDAGSPVFALASHKISAICAHTNLDAAAGGVNDVLAGKMGLAKTEEFAGLGRVGYLPKAYTPEEMARLCAQALGSYVQLAGAQKPISRLAVAGGSGGSYWRQAQAAGADCLLTGEASHHDALDAVAAGLTVIAAGHFATEWPIVEVLAGALQKRFADTEVLISRKNKAPFTVVAQ